jgi:hypothetical protein
MVGIQRKITQLMKIIQKFAPVLNNIVPGLGAVVGTLGSVGEKISDGAYNVYEDYKSAKSKGKKFGLGDGIKSFAGVDRGNESSVSSQVKRPPAAMSSLTKSYGQLHPRLKLKAITDGSETGEQE